MHDYLLPKPPGTTGYALHRLVAGLLDGAPCLFADKGDHLVLRADRPFDGLAARPVREVATGDILAFSLRACVGAKVRGRHRYFPTQDWRARHEWLGRQGELHGFSLITVHCSAGIARIDKGDKVFTVDDTQFDGVLKVTDAARFEAALRTGIGNKGKAFGFGLLLV